MVGDSLFAYGLTGEGQQADGNAHPQMAPHGCYPCADGQWLSLAVASEGEWLAFCQVLDAAALTTDPSFVTIASRIANRHALDEAIAALMQGQEAEALAQRLRAQGVPAFRSQSSIDLLSESFFWESGAYRMVADAQGNSRPIIGPSWHMVPDEATITRAAPRLGEHNDYVYRELLGISEAELADLIARKVVD
jgi:crotonobetainyl-CoA:carnitine CoA-transferase CaiB-like acyl-CoA transferase